MVVPLYDVASQLQRLYRVDNEKSVELLDEFELDKGEDAPMSMAAHAESRKIICGVNSSEEYLQNGHNQNCRMFKIKEGKYVTLAIVSLSLF